MLKNRIALVTGATSGIGYALAHRLARDGWRVILHGRDPDRCRVLADQIGSYADYRPQSYAVDFDSLTDVMSFAEQLEAEWGQLHLLVNNAGTGFTGKSVSTSDGYDATMQVNYLSPYILMRKLRPLMVQTPNAIVLNIGSQAQYPFRGSCGFEPMAKAGIAYGRSKLALAMATREFASDRAWQGVRFLCVHPGSMIASGLSERLLRLAPWPMSAILRRSAAKAPSPENAAAFLSGLISGQHIRWETGAYLSNESKAKPHRQLDDAAVRASLIIETERVIEPFMRP